MQKFYKTSIAIHGGAGTLLSSQMTAEKEKDYKKALEDALREGIKIVENGGSAIDAAIAAVISMEDSPLFNAGKGSVFTNEGKHEMDASIMCGKTLEAGAVAAVRNIKNPISLAKVVMQHSDHIILSGKGAKDFARKMNIEFEPDQYFFTQNRYDQWMKIRDTDNYQLDHSAPVSPQNKFGTVGAVVLDQHGNLSAATSTGGMTNKRYGRIGDSPIIGAGTYANNQTCAVSCTGYGEYFIRAVTAYDVSCLMEYKGMTLKEACETVINEKLVKLGGEGGLIAVDRNGNLELLFNSAGMYRAWKRNGKPMQTAIYQG